MVNHRVDVIRPYGVVLLQHKQVLPRLEELSVCFVDVAEQNECAREPVLLLRIHLREVHDLRFGSLEVIKLEIALGEQILGFGSASSTYFGSQGFEVRLGLGPLSFCYECFGTSVECFRAHLVADWCVTQDLVSDVDGCLVTSQTLRATEYTEAGDLGVLATRGEGVHAIERLHRGGIVAG